MVATGFTSGDTRKVDVAGDTMTGDLILLDSTPDTALSAASRGYVDAAVAGGGGAGMIPLTQKGAPGGVAELDGAALLPHAQLPALAGADITSGTVAYARLPVGAIPSTVAAGDDPRLGDARTPTAHKTSHQTGGTDAITPDMIGAEIAGAAAAVTVSSIGAATAAALTAEAVLARAAEALIVPRWQPATAYALNQQVVSPNNDVVNATVAHTSSAAYATDLAKWGVSSTYGLTPRVPARFLSKMLTGANVKVTLLGDSIYQGSTASIPGTNDALSLFATAMATRYGVTVTKSNQGQGGRTAFWEKLEKWPTALADNADLYILGMTGKNDAPWTGGNSLPSKLGGYENLASLAQIESMIRELKATHPAADIMIASGNPYGGTTGATGTNGAQKSYSAGLALLAAAYDLPYADGWNLFPKAAGYPDNADAAYLTDGVHPNTAGHAVLGAAMIALCPASFSATSAASTGLLPAQPATTCIYPVRQSVAGVKSLTTASTTPGTDRIINPNFIHASWTGTGPWTSSTVGAEAWFMARATDLFVLFTQGAGQGSVDITADGILVAAAVNLAGMSAGAWLSVASGLLPGVHNFRIKVVTGPVSIVGMAWTAAPAEFVPITSSRITAANLGAAENTNEWYGQVSNASLTTTTVSLDFVGTGVLLQARSATGGSGGFYFASVKIDGVNVTAPIWPANMVAAVANVALPGCTGLPYGKHTILLTYQAAGLYTGGLTVIDEHPEAHPNACEGVAKVGETVRFPYPWTDAPTVVVTTASANAAGASTVTATSFIVTGTAGEIVRWKATGTQRGVY